MTNTARNGNLETTTYADGYTYSVCTVCARYQGAHGCAAKQCAAPLASSFRVGDPVCAFARGSLRAGIVVSVKRTRLVVSYKIKSGAARTSTVKHGLFHRARV